MCEPAVGERRVAHQTRNARGVDPRPPGAVAGALSGLHLPRDHAQTGGGLGPPTAFDPVPSTEGRGLATGDFDLDGHLDVVVTSTDASGYFGGGTPIGTALLFGGGDGTLLTSTSYDSGGSPQPSS